MALMIMKYSNTCQGPNNVIMDRIGQQLENTWSYVCVHTYSWYNR